MALNPVASLSVFLLPFVISGTVLVSIVMDLPTLGPIFLKAIVLEDFNLAAGIILLLGALTVAGSLLSDIVLVWVDPRVRFGARK